MKTALATLVASALVVAFALSGTACHGELSDEQLLADGSTAERIRQLIKEIRYRSLGASEIFLAELRESEPAPPPDPGGGGPSVPVTPTEIDAISGGTFAVTLGVPAAALARAAAEGEFDTVFLSVDGDAQGSFEVDLDPDGTGSSFLGVELFVTLQEDIRFKRFDLVLTPQRGGVTGQPVTATVRVTPTCGGGDIKVTLEWDNGSDLDLEILDPDGERIAFDADLERLSVGFQQSVATGGGPCEPVLGRLYETFCWEGGPLDLVTPRGTYTVSVLPSDLCPGTTRYVLTVITESFVQVVEDQLFAPLESPAAALEEPAVFTFQYPGVVDLALRAAALDAAQIAEEVPFALDLSLENRLDGGNDANDVEVALELTQGLRFLSGQPPPPQGSLDLSGAFPEDEHTPPRLVFRDLDVADGETLALSAVVRVPFGSIAGGLDAVAAEARIVSLKERDPLATNDRATFSGTGLSGNAFVDLGVSFLDVQNQNPAEGEAVGFLVRVDNGPLAASAADVVVSLPLPGGLTLDPSATIVPQGSQLAGGAWTIDALAPGAEVVLELVATVDQGAAGQDLVLTAALQDVNEPDGEEFSADDQASAPAVHVRPVALFDAQPASGFAPLEVRFDSSASRGDVSERRWSFGDGSPLLTTTDAVVMHVFEESGSFAVVLETLDAGFAGATSAPLAIDVQDPVDLGVTQSVDDANPAEGATVTFTVTVRNDAQTTEATGVALEDALPAGLALAQASPSQGTYSGSSWQVGTLAPGASATLLLAATVAGGTAGQTLVNTAGGLTADQPDLSSGNDTASATVRVRPVAIFEVAPASGFAGLTTFAFTDLSRGATSWSWDFGDEGGSSEQNPQKVYAAPGAYTVVLTASGPTGSDVASVEVEVGAALDLVVEKTVSCVEGSCGKEPSGTQITASEGDSVRFQVAVANASTTGTSATNVSLLDAFPAGLSLQKAFGDGAYDVESGLWQVGTLDAGKRATLFLDASVDPGSGGLTITNTAGGLTLDQTDIDPSNDAASASVVVLPRPVAAFSIEPPSGAAGDDSVTFTNLSSGASAYSWSFGDQQGSTSAATSVTHAYAAAGRYLVTLTASGPGGADTTPPMAVDVLDLRVSLSALQTQVCEDDEVAYRATVSASSANPVAATGVTLDLPLPQGFVLVGADPDTGSYANERWTIGSLAPGGGAALTLVLSPPLGTTTLSTGALRLAQFELPAANASGATVSKVVCK